MKRNFNRIVAFLKRYSKHPVYVAVYGYTFLLRDFSFKIHFYAKNEIVDLIRGGKSIIRFGDGEISTIPLGLKNAYQTPNLIIKKMLDSIVREYSAESTYVLSVPRFLNTPNSELKQIGKFHLWLPVKVMFFLRFNKKTPYMDAHNFYYNRYVEDVVGPIFKDKVIVCVTKEETIRGLRNNPNIPWVNIKYVITPEKEALPEYENIKTAIDAELLGVPPKDAVLLVAMGPVGKYLIFEYANKGYQGIDIGKGLEVAFTNESIEHLSV